MKREGKNSTDKCPNLVNYGHNINQLLDYLGAGQNLKLPPQLIMSPLHSNKERKFTVGEINQMWRYGGSGDNIKDDQLEEQLDQISKWIEMELRG